MIIERNVFTNPSYPHELVGGLENTIDMSVQLDGTLNFWGTTDPLLITKRIFDFDDWNSFSAVNFNSFLTSPDLSQLAVTSITDVGAYLKAAVPAVQQLPILSILFFFWVFPFCNLDEGKQIIWNLPFSK